MASWRATGGEPDIARDLPMLLRKTGFRVVEALNAAEADDRSLMVTPMVLEILAEAI
jgi:hypothetical protein